MKSFVSPTSLWYPAIVGLCGIVIAFLCAAVSGPTVTNALFPVRFEDSAIGAIGTEAWTRNVIAGIGCYTLAILIGGMGGAAIGGRKAGRRNTIAGAALAIGIALACGLSAAFLLFGSLTRF